MTGSGSGIIADVRAAWFRLHVVTRYRVRFYEMPDGRLAFAVWTGLRADAHLADRLRTIDQDDGG